MQAGFINPNNISWDDPRVEKRWLLWNVTVFDWVMNDPPVMFCRPSDGSLIKLGYVNGTTDFASTPPFLWSIPNFNPQRFVRGSTFHDAFYQMCWCYRSFDDGKTWQEWKMRRKDADILLYEMILFDPNAGSLFDARAYYIGVRVGGVSAWNKKRVKK
jgi:hypothetical protein